MNNEELVATPPVEGVSPEGDSQATPVSTQVPETPQETGQPQVESPAQSASSTPSGRAVRPSEHYEIRNLKKQLKELDNFIRSNLAKPQTPPPEAPAVNREDLNRRYLEDPVGFTEKSIQDSLQKMRAEILEKEIPTYLSNAEKNQTLKTQTQEALEMLIPKDSSNPNAPLAVRAQQHQELLANYDRIMKDNKLDLVGQHNPMAAAKMTLMLYNEEIAAKKTPPMNPNAPKKAQMVTTAAGASARLNGGNTKMETKDIQALAAVLDDKLDKNPNYRYTDEYAREHKVIMDSLSAKAAELSTKK